MKVSEVTIKEAIRFCNAYDDEETTKDIELIKAGAISFIKGYTGLAENELDKYEDITIALLVLINEMFDNRNFTIDKDKVNPMIVSILDLHSINLL